MLDEIVDLEECGHFLFPEERPPSCPGRCAAQSGALQNRDPTCG
jgi:hypothetical protein